MKFHLHRQVLMPLLLAPSLAWAELPSLTVHVSGAEPASGTVEVTVFDSPETFLAKAYLQRSGTVGEDGLFTAIFSAIPEGDYAVVVVHDANDNKKLDNGILGFGAESFAYSNGASNPLFGRASFEDAKIEVNDDLEIEISLD
jgi:uncharacterized protein (DUF2141 family)